jgi:hypothetical protein
VLAIEKLMLPWVAFSEYLQNPENWIEPSVGLSPYARIKNIPLSLLKKETLVFDILHTNSEPRLELPPLKEYIPSMFFMTVLEIGVVFFKLAFRLFGGKVIPFFEQEKNITDTRSKYVSRYFMFIKLKT